MRLNCAGSVANARVMHTPVHTWAQGLAGGTDEPPKGRRAPSHPRQHLVYDEPDKVLAWWFARFHDDDLLVLARALANRRAGSIEAVAEHRARLQMPEP
jgi:hypothetical protein